MRDTILRGEGQLKEEGIELPFKSVLAEATFCGNALLTINGSTPYNAVYGRVPSILPSIDQVVPPDAEAEQPLIRHTLRLREVSVPAMIEGSARARLGRAENTRLTRSAENLNLQIGEEIGFFRPPNKKDVSGWSGPAVAVDVSKASRGIITLKWQNQVTEAMTHNVR